MHSAKRNRAPARKRSDPINGKDGQGGGIRFRPVWLLLIPILSFAVYGNSLSGDFVWDDRPLILNDYTVKSFNNLEELFTNDFFYRKETDLSYGYYRPVTTLTYVLDYAVWGARAVGYHLTNVLLHAIATILLFAVLRRLGMEPWTSLLAALLFAVHPIHTENIAWIAGRTDVVAFVFSLTALVLHLKMEKDDRADRYHSALEVVSACLFGLALLAKEMAVVLIPWVFLFHFKDKGIRPSIVRTVPFAAVFALYVVWRFFALGIPAPGQPQSHGWGVALLSALPTMLRYVQWLILPLHQSAYVQNPYVKSVFDPRFVGAIAMVACAVWIAYRKARRNQGFVFLSAAFVVSFLPILNFVRIAGPEDMGNMMAERFAYFGSAPFLALAAAAFTALVNRTAGRSRRRNWIAFGLLAALFATWMSATILRNRAWKDDPTLYKDILAQAPDASLIWSNLANYYIRDKKVGEAREALQKIKDLNDKSYFFYSSQVLLYIADQQYEKAIPLQEKIVAAVKEGNAVARNNLAFLYRTIGRVDDAIAILERLLQDGKGYYDVNYNLAKAYQSKGRYEDARHQYRLALKSQPDALPIGTAYAGMELSLERYRDAVEIFKNLERYYPGDARVLNNLAIAQERAGHDAAALESFSQAVENDPSYVKARFNYAKLLSKTGDAVKARQEFEEVLRRAPQSQFAEEARQALER